MNAFAKGGRGKKAPYQSQMYRVALPIKPIVEKLNAAYRLLVEGDLDPKGIALLARVDDAITTSTYPLEKADIRNKETNKSDIQNELEDDENQEEEENQYEDEPEDLERSIKEQAAKIQELLVDNRMLEREKKKLGLDLDEHYKSITCANHHINDLLEQEQALRLRIGELEKENEQLHVRNGDLNLELVNCEEKLEKVQKQETVYSPSPAITLLVDALKLKANAGGAIKEEIKRAIALLKGVPQTR